MNLPSVILVCESPMDFERWAYHPNTDAPLWVKSWLRELGYSKLKELYTGWILEPKVLVVNSPDGSESIVCWPGEIPDQPAVTQF